MRNWIVEYAEAIERGDEVVSKKVARVYLQLRDEALNPRGRWILDLERGNRPIEFARRFCRHSKGEWAGKPVEFELWQKAYLCALFGFVDRDTGVRRYKETLLEVARKCGKSLMMSVIALYMLIADGEAGAEVYSVATKKDQAALIFNESCNMVSQSPALQTMIRKRRGDLWCEASMSTFAALGRNSDTMDGLNCSCCVMDELHGIKDRNLYEVMVQSMSARRQPLLVMITTAGTVRESIFDDRYEYAEKVIDGTIEDERFLPVIYELDDRDEWRDPSKWRKANPGLGVVKSMEYLEEKVKRAKDNPADLTGVLCKDFDIRSSSHTSWLQFEDINNTETFDLTRFRGCWAIGGADLSITTDLTCATVLMIDPVTETRYVKQMYWLPEANVEQRVHDEKIPYDRWHEHGLVRYCKGNSIRYSDVTDWFKEIVLEHGISIAWVYYDPYSARYWQDEMASEGFEMVRCYQGAKTLSLPMQQMGQDLKAKRIVYDNNPVTKWCLSNTGIEVDRNGNIVPVKAQAAKQRIDGTASMLDAYVGLMEHYNEFLEANR